MCQFFIVGNEVCDVNIAEVLLDEYVLAELVSESLVFSKQSRYSMHYRTGR